MKKSEGQKVKMTSWPEFYFDSEFESASEYSTHTSAVKSHMLWNLTTGSYQRSGPALSLVQVHAASQAELHASSHLPKPKPDSIGRDPERASPFNCSQSASNLLKPSQLQEQPLSLHETQQGQLRKIKQALEDPAVPNGFHEPGQLPMPGPNLKPPVPAPRSRNAAAQASSSSSKRQSVAQEKSQPLNIGVQNQSPIAVERQPPAVQSKPPDCGGKRQPLGPPRKQPPIGTQVQPLNADVKPPSQAQGHHPEPELPPDPDPSSKMKINLSKLRATRPTPMGQGCP